MNDRALLTTNPRKDERCACGSFAQVRFGEKPLCADHFGKTFERIAMDMKIQALVDLVRANGYTDVMYPEGMRPRDIVEALA